MIKRIWGIFISRRLAVYLLTIFLFLLIIGSIFNINIQKNLLFLIISISLIITTFLCSIERVYKWIEGLGIKGLGIKEEGIKGYEAVLNKNIAESHIRDILKKEGFRIIDNGSINLKDSLIIGRKGDIGFIGSILFHISLIIVIFGLLYHILTGFSGSILITEGEELKLKKENLINISKEPIIGLLPDISITLKDFSSYYKDNKYPIEHIGNVIIREKEGIINKRVRINDPLVYKGFKFLMVLYGFSPLFLIKDIRGNEIFNSYVRLDVAGLKRDSFAARDLYINTWFFPDFSLNNGKPITISSLPNNPVFYIEVFKGRERLFKGFIRFGEEIIFDRYIIIFQDIRYWITLNIVKQEGITYIFVSLFLGCIGVLIRFLSSDLILMIDRSRKDMIIFKSYSPNFPDLFKDRMERLKIKLEGEP